MEAEWLIIVQCSPAYDNEERLKLRFFKVFLAAAGSAAAKNTPSNGHQPEICTCSGS